MNSDEHLRYPIGRLSSKESYTPEEVKAFIQRIGVAPAQIEMAAKALADKGVLDVVYREGGWTARQVIHHLADSHLNAYIRSKWTLTEDTPIIKPYNEKAWATTPETHADPADSIVLLKALHTKWVALLNSLKAEDFNKKFYHPDSKKHVRLDQTLATYAWHGEHHLGHLNIVLGK